MKHFQLKDFHKDNWHLYERNPDKNFSPEHNFAVINQTIADYEKMRFGIDPKVTKAAGDRADILASWTKYKLDINGGKQVEEWLGKDLYKRIAGEQIVERAKMMDSVGKLQRKKMKTLPKGIYL